MKNTTLWEGKKSLLWQWHWQTDKLAHFVLNVAKKIMLPWTVGRLQQSLNLPTEHTFMLIITVTVTVTDNLWTWVTLLPSLSWSWSWSWSQIIYLDTSFGRSPALPQTPWLFPWNRLEEGGGMLLWGSHTAPDWLQSSQFSWIVGKPHLGSSLTPHCVVGYLVVGVGIWQALRALRSLLVPGGLHCIW